ncbi:hypothetical protein [Streptomyces sp. NPDC001508]|uniref:hypothetical protein n=1 Tax=Streptomyces sp. NPDC001508 TaxID=3154656 RepID=UPI0033287C06
MPRTPNTRLRALMAEAGLGPSQLARMLRSVAAERGVPLACDQTAVRRWLAGAHPRPPAPALLLECLARKLDKPVTAQDAGLTRTPATVINSPEQAPVRTLIQLTQAEFDPSRRVVLGASGFSLAALSRTGLAMFDRPTQQPSAATAAPTRADQAHIDEISAMAALFHGAAERHGGQSIRAALAAYLADRVAPLLRGSPRDTVHRQLLSAIARLTLLLGIASADSGHHGVGQYYHRSAARLAGDAGDSVTFAIALRVLATQAHDLGHHSPAVLNLAEQAVAHARHAPPAVLAYALAHLAVVQAHGDRRAALASLARAEHFHARADTAPGPFTGYPAGALHYQRAQTLAALGDLTGARAALTVSLRLRTADEPRATALTRAYLAETHLRIGHLDEALSQWRIFLAAYPTLHSARAARRLQTTTRQLQPHRRHPAVRQFLTEAAALAS